MKKGPSTVVNNVTIHERPRTDLTRAIGKLYEVAGELLHAADPATRKSVLLLIVHVSGLKQRDVKKVLIAASELKRKYAP